MKAQILAKLRQNNFVSGQEIADELNISRTAVFKHIKALEKIGFVIESIPKKGYRLKRETENLHPLVVNKCLKTKFIGRPIIHFEQVASTINQAMLKTEKQQGLVVVAEKQNKGRGRFQRMWHSPRGGIWTSILLKPQSPPAQAARLNVVASLAIAEAIEEKTKIETLIKWPNDVIVRQKKVAGILTEMAAELDRINFAILSFGINVNNNISKELLKTAISLKQTTGKKVDRIDLFCRILNRFELYYLQWQKGSFENILNKWRTRCLTLGKQVKVSGLNRTLSGKAVDVDEDGRLILKTADGKRHNLSAGEVTITS